MARRFERREAKVLLTSPVRDALWPTLASLLRPDPWASDGVYELATLYYDSRDLACYRAKQAGLPHRELRVRRYDASDSVQVEIKERADGGVRKRRIGLPLADAYALCERRLHAPIGDELDRQLVDEITAFASGLAPTCVIGARRHALVGPGLRVTCDDRLWVSDATTRLSPAATTPFLDHAVLEIKTDGAGPPAWLHRLLAAHGCAVAPFSKYSAGLARLQLAA